MSLPPLTPELALTPVGGAIIAEVLALWLAKYLADWRWRPLLLLGSPFWAATSRHKRAATSRHKRAATRAAPYWS